LRRALPLATLIVAIATIASAARAEPSDAEKKAAAQALFDEARKLTADGSFAQACPKLEESVRLDPTPGSKFYLADCFEHAGKLASAWTYYLDAADSAKSAGSTDREKFARERAEAVKARLTSVAVSVPPAVRAIHGLLVQRDGVTLGEGQWDAAIPVNPGRHVVAASAPGKVAWESAIDADAPGSTINVAVPALLDVVKPPPPRVDPAPLPLPPTPPRASRARQQIAGIVVGSLGVVLAGVGAGFGVDAASKLSRSNDAGHCDAKSFCDGTGLALRHDAIGSATISTVGFLAGGTLLAGGVVLVLTAPAAASKIDVALAPGSLVVSGRF
jgi:hypothetical protein